jgi:hypothetical protein
MAPATAIAQAESGMSYVRYTIHSLQSALVVLALTEDKLLAAKLSQGVCLGAFTSLPEHLYIIAPSGTAAPKGLISEGGEAGPGTQCNHDQ